MGLHPEAVVEDAVTITTKVEDADRTTTATVITRVKTTETTNRATINESVRDLVHPMIVNATTKVAVDIKAADTMMMIADTMMIVVVVKTAAAVMMKVDTVMTVDIVRVADAMTVADIAKVAADTAMSEEATTNIVRNTMMTDEDQSRQEIALHPDIAADIMSRRRDIVHPDMEAMKGRKQGTEAAIEVIEQDMKSDKYFLKLYKKIEINTKRNWVL